MNIRIIKAGVLTIQDTGRYNYLHMAVPVSGAMDMVSARMANLCVGNTESDAVIEFTYAGDQFITETDVLIALSGDGAELKADNWAIPSNRPVFIPADTVITLTGIATGCRSYLAIAGGWDVPLVMGSRSTFLTAHFGGLHGRRLKGNDVMNANDNLSATAKAICNSLKGSTINYPKWSAVHRAVPNDGTIRIIPAREYTWFEAASITAFLSQPYTLSSDCDRMGYRLNGPVVGRVNNAELLSTAVAPGTIQVTGDGSLILLMADCQTTGGYPRIAQVCHADIPLCAQLKPGDSIRFKQISWNEAEMLYIEQEKDMRQLAAAIRRKYAY